MASTRVTTYSADEVDVLFAGVRLESGFAEGEFVSIEMNADDFTDKAGADGEVARAKTNDRRATVKIKTLQTSQANDVLSELRRVDLAGTNGAGVGVLRVVDRSSGKVIAHASKAWISKAPTVARAREVVEYEWTLRAAHMDLDPSGNPAI